jgi:hypothetical protein
MQNCFRLIVRMMCQENPIERLVSQGFVTHPARRGFKPFARLFGDIHSEHC